MKKKLFIALYTTGIVLAVVLLSVIVTSIKQSPSVAETPEEKADTSLAQYAERPNSTTTFGTSHITAVLFSYLFPRAQPLAEGCSLRFSFAPQRKAVEPRGDIDYVLTLSNRGKEVCKNVSLSVYYTNEELFVVSNPVPTASDYYWAVGDLASAGEYVITLKTTTSAVNGSQMISEGCATADNSPDVCSQNVIFVQTGATPTSSLLEKINVPTFTGIVWGKPFVQKEFGIWVWDSIRKMTPAYAKQVISVAQKNGFNVIYLTIDDYITISEMKDATARTEDKAEYMKSLSVFIQAAQSAGIAVDVVGGSKDWAIKENRWKGYALIDFVKEYNQTYPTIRIHGLQYDVEPYLLAEYETDKAKVLKEYVEFIDESTQRMKDVNARFSIVIPHFYDSTQKWTPSFRYGGQNAYAYTHLLTVLSQKKDTEIILMSYRNFFEEENGTREISQAEIEEASSGAYTTKIIVAQETGNVSPDYVTFHDYPKVSLFDALFEIQSYYKGYKNYGGTAVHYFDSFMKLE